MEIVTQNTKVQKYKNESQESKVKFIEGNRKKTFRQDPQKQKYTCRHKEEVKTSW